MGFIKLSHKLLDWEWYDNVNVKVLFIHCLLRANYKPGSWHGIHYEAGQFITSLSTLSKETGQTIRMVRDNLDKLILTGELTSTILSKGRLITVNNWSLYQTNDKVSDKEMTSTLTSNPTSNTATDKEYKNIRIKDNIRFVPPTVDEVRTYCQEKGYMDRVNPNKFVDFYESKGWMVGKNKMKDWKAAVRNWASKDKDFSAQKVNKFNNFEQRKYDFSDLERLAYED